MFEIFINKENPFVKVTEAIKYAEHKDKINNLIIFSEDNKYIISKELSYLSFFHYQSSR